jgi:hypothetical protein
VNATLRPTAWGGFVSVLHQLLRKARALPDAADDEVSHVRYGPETERAVRAFQRHERLVEDAIVGPRTWAALANAAKHVRAPRGMLEMLSFYGDPRSKADPGAVSTWWEQKNCVVITDLVGVPKLYVHKKIVEPLRAAWARATAKGWKPRQSVGCFNPRNQKNSNKISTHFFAAGLDVDPDTNPFIDNCPLGDPRRAAWERRPDRLPDEFFYGFQREGWTLGRDFHGTRFDPMHVQYAEGI